ncbi:thioredoxin-like, partial [Saccoglossus kowalevskii]
TQEEFDAELKAAGDRLVVVDFSAQWCGPCRMIAPKVKDMAKEFPDLVFLKIDVDENPVTSN